MNIHVTDTVDSLISTDLKAAKILSKHGIDYCSEGGKKSIKEACEEANISFRKLLRKIREAELSRKKALPDVAALPVDELTRYIERHHHLATYDNITFIKINISRLTRVFGKQHPELEEMSDVFQEMTAHITIHMQHEEMIVFPYIRQLTRKGRKKRSAIFKTVGSPILAMIAEHQKGDPYLHRLAELTHHYVVPGEWGNAFKATYDAMKDLEKDLHEHLTIENEILFPKALQIEGQFDTRTWLTQN